MAENKTKVTPASAQGYVAAIDDDSRRKDCEALTKLMTNATQHPPKMWGSSIVGFGSYHYKYESGREGDACLVGFSSRKGAITMYGLHAAADAGKLLARLGNTSREGLRGHQHACRRRHDDSFETGRQCGGEEGPGGVAATPHD